MTTRRLLLVLAVLLAVAAVALFALDPNDSADDVHDGEAWFVTATAPDGAAISEACGSLDGVGSVAFTNTGASAGIRADVTGRANDEAFVACLVEQGARVTSNALVTQPTGSSTPQDNL